MTTEEEARIRADERERCAAVAEAGAQRHYLSSQFHREQGNELSMDRCFARMSACKDVAAAIRSGTDTDYVCVRREKLEAIDDMITNCAGVPNNPDSLIRMVQYEIRSLLKERGGENG